MKKKSLIFVLVLCLLVSLTVPVSAESETAVELTEIGGTVGTEESAGAPPETFTVYVQAGDSDPVLFATYTGREMREMAAKSNPEKTTLKYSSVSGSGYAGRVTTEYIKVSDFIQYISEDEDVGMPLCLGSGDYIIMGDDLTKDQELIDDGYGRDVLTGNWYSYDNIVGAQRFYFPNWSSGSEEGAVSVPAVIGLKSYGGKSGVTDTMLDYYASSADYLWAYVLYYGQKTYADATYSYFYYGQNQAIIRYDDNAAMNDTIAAILDANTQKAEELLANTVVADSAETVAEGKFWVTQAQYDALSKAKAAADAANDVGVKNGTAYDAALALSKQCETFLAARSSGTKSGYFWYTETEGDTYIINTAQQLNELGRIVNGVAVDQGTGISIEQDSFSGKTVLVACDIDLEGLQIRIGNSDYAFSGTFDGQGYTISNMYTGGKTTGYSGMFGNVGTGGVVKDFTLSGTVSSTGNGSSIGGIAGMNFGTIENVRCKVSVSGTSDSFVGGIAGCNAGTIKNTLFSGTVSGGSVGGIAGKNSGMISGCLNASSSALTGVNTETGSVIGCISSQAPLAAENNGSISCSYTPTASAIGSGSGTASSVYCLASDTAESGVTALANAADFESADVLNALNSSGSFKAVEGGYPCLDWQNVYDVYFELLLTGNTMEPVQVGEYMPIIRPDDPTAKKDDGTGNLVTDNTLTFGGWYSSDNPSQTYDFSALAAGTVKLYAKWTDENGKTIYTLTINLIRHSAAGEKTKSTTYFQAEESEYSYALETFDGYVGEKTVAAGTMPGESLEINVNYYMLGDVNKDSAINSTDAMLVLNGTAGSSTTDQLQSALSDYDKDGKATSSDAMAILAACVG